jgi:CRP/FNR family transcriptional regulator
MQISAQLALHPSPSGGPSTGFEQVLAKATMKRVEAKELVFAEGDEASHVYRVETGAVALFKILVDGRRQILGFAYPGDLVGLGAEGEHVINAQAIKPTRLLCLPVSGLHHSLFSDPSLGFKLYQAIAQELASARDLMLTTGQRTATERVASFLLAFSRRNACNGRDPTVLELPMTRTDIGDFLGLTVETVSRTFTKLRTMGLIALPHSAEVKLVDVDALQIIADGDAQDL